MNNMEWVDYMNDANALLPDYPFATPSEYVISNVSNNRLLSKIWTGNLIVTSSKFI